MPKFAVIKTGGKQYLVKPGQKLRVEKLPEGPVIFKEVLLTGDDENNLYVGTPFLKNASVEAERISDGKEKKVIVARYHSKTRYRKTKGHRQPFTEVLIKTIR